uniref:Uncharacterized protein n=1 Tax=Schistocephalus solidus TaxID=70667 RepID=A0A0V0JC60_SCHSO
MGITISRSASDARFPNAFIPLVQMEGSSSGGLCPKLRKFRNISTGVSSSSEVAIANSVRKDPVLIPSRNDTHSKYVCVTADSRNLRYKSPFGPNSMLKN